MTTALADPTVWLQQGAAARLLGQERRRRLVAQGPLRAEPDLRRSREPRRLTVRLHSGGMPRRATRAGAPAYPVFSPARGDQHMSDQPSSGAAAAAPPPAAEAVQPLTPPASTSSVLTLEPPAAVGVVNETAAPKMAPQVPAAAVPGLDAKVDSYLDRAAHGRRPARPSSTTKADRRAHDGRRRHPPRRRVEQPHAPDAGQGAQRGRPQSRPARSARPCSTCAGRSRTSTPARRAGAKKLLGMIPFGDRSTTTSASTSRRRATSTASSHSLHDGQDELQQGQRRARTGEDRTSGTSMGRLHQYVYVAERLDARLTAQIATDRGHRPRAGQGAQARTCSSTSARSTRTC